LTLLRCSKQTKRVPVFMLKRWNLYSVINWGSCVENISISGGWLCIFLSASLKSSLADMERLLEFGWRCAWVESWWWVKPLCQDNIWPHQVQIMDYIVEGEKLAIEYALEMIVVRLLSHVLNLGIQRTLNKTWMLAKLHDIVVLYTIFGFEYNIFRPPCFLVGNTGTIHFNVLFSTFIQGTVWVTVLAVT